MKHSERLDPLADLQHAGIAPVDAGLQQRKSAETRLTILDAAIKCLAQKGYSHTSTQLIAKVAKVSRGAMLHHYATKQALIEAVTDYAFYRHMERFIDAVAALSDQARKEENFGIRVDWQLYLSEEYSAYLELLVAARTDDELRAMFIRKARRHDMIWREQLLKIFPEWANDEVRLEKSRRLVQSVMSGMVLNREIWNDRAIEDAVLDMLSTLLIGVRDSDKV